MLIFLTRSERGRKGSDERVKRRLPIFPPPGPAPMPKIEQGPCMRYKIDMEIYNATGERVMIEQPTEFVSPIDPMAAPEHNPTVRRKGQKFTMNANKPKKEALDKDLKTGMRMDDIAKKYDCSARTILNWIKGYGLTGIKGKRLSKVEVVQKLSEAEIAKCLDDAVNEIMNGTGVGEPVGIMSEENMSKYTIGIDLAKGEDVCVQSKPEPQSMTPAPYPGCFSDYNPNLYGCKNCGYLTECFTMFSKSDLEPQGMTAEENMTDAEWEAEQILTVKSVLEKSCEEILRGAMEDIRHVERVYAMQAKEIYREKIREMFAELMEE